MPTPTIKRTPRCQSRLTTTPWRQKRHTALLVLIATLGVAVPGTAGAEDFSLRVGAGLDLEAQTQFTDRDCSSAPRTPLYGCGRGDDGAPLRSLGDFRTAASLELGLGYTAAPALRIEALVEYRPHVAFKGHTNFLAPTQLQSVSTDLSSLSGMLAAYVDLPALGLPPLGPFSPFIGGGLGAAHTRIDETRMTFPKTTTIVPGAGPDRFRLDADGGARAALRREDDTRSGLALHGLRHRRDRGGQRTGHMARWKPGTAGAQSRPDAGKAAEPWGSPVRALRVLKSSTWSRVRHSTLDATFQTCQDLAHEHEASTRPIGFAELAELVVAALTGGSDVAYLRIYGAALKMRWLFFFEGPSPQR